MVLANHDLAYFRKARKDNHVVDQILYFLWLYLLIYVLHYLFSVDDLWHFFFNSILSSSDNLDKYK
jgi:hypothetical protein